MSAAPSRDDPRALDFTVSLSAEPAFAETAGALAARAGDYAGCAADAARRLGDAVREVFEAMAASVATRQVVKLVFHGDDRLVRVELRCPRDADLEHCLGQRPGAEPVTALVDRVEFGTDGTQGYCRLTQQIRPPR